MAAAHQAQPGTDGYARVGDRLHAAAERSFVGRDDELAVLLHHSSPGSPAAVVHVHGPGGIGKTALLAAFARRSPRPVLQVDGAELEPTPAGLIAAVGGQLRSLGAASGVGASTAAVADALAELGPATIAVDGYERLAMLDAWLRNELLPRLPARVTTVLAGRGAPSAAWRAAPGWRELLVEVPLGPLDPGAAAELVARRGLSGRRAADVQRFAGGYPLALELAAAAARRGVAVAGGEPEVVAPLVRTLLADLDADAVQVVEAASVVRRVTEPLLDALLAGDEPGAGARPAARVVDRRAAWAAVSRLPFTVLTRHGAELHDVVRDAVAADLEARDLERFRALRRRAVAHLARQSGRSTWAATADLLYLVRHPVVRDAFFPPGGLQHPVEPALAEDAATILQIAARHVPASADLVAAWLSRHPGAFVVSRGGDGGRVVAFSAILERDELDRELAGRDPVARAWLRHLARDPVPAGAKVLFHRFAVGASHGASPSPELAPMWIDTKRAYLELRPRLRRLYAATASWPDYEPILAPLGFRTAGPPVEDGPHLQPLVLDFGEGSVDGWLARIVDVDVPPLATAAAASSPAGPLLAALTGREREVLALVAEGLTNRELAARLFISERTANRHLTNIFTKLGVSSRAAAARMAAEAGLDRPPAAATRT
jgi:DNA-binding CsgD family transcriptional regulator